MKIFLTGANGFVGGSVAHHLIAQGHSVRGLLRDPQKAGRLQAQGITPVIGSLDDRQLLIDEARQADAVIDAANSGHAGAVDAFIEALRGSGKLLIHTSGSSIIGDDALGNTCPNTSLTKTPPSSSRPPSKPATTLTCA
jgi:uncharacterized protein YbjT (DUF2867 family)